jgi:hypothetical protein
MTHVRNIKTFAVAWTLAAMTAACSSELSLDASATGEARLLMARDASPSEAAAPAESPAGTYSVPQDTVESFVVTVTAVEFLAAGATDTSATSSAWTRVDAGSAFDLDLMSLSTGSAQLVASGDVEAGAYARVRLRITNPRIRFKGDVSFGAGETLQGGTDIAVVIPSVAQVGLQASLNFTVEANTSNEVTLVFESARSLGQVTITGAGQVMMSPVLRAQ